MKTIIIHILLALPLCAFSAVPGTPQGTPTEFAADATIKKFTQNELDFEADPEKVMDANALLMDDMIKSGLAKDRAAIDLETSTADELARVGFLSWAYSDDNDITHDLLFKAAQGGNAASCNFLGTLLYYNGNSEKAAEIIYLATQLDPFYLPALYNLIMLQILRSPQPDKKTVDWIIRHANAYYNLLATICSPEWSFSVPDYRMLEIITDPHVKEESSANLKRYMRGHGLLYHIRKVVPDYKPPVVFETN